MTEAVGRRVALLLALAAVVFAWRSFFTFFGVDDFAYVLGTFDRFPGVTRAAGDRYLADVVAFVTLREMVGLDHRWYHLVPFVLHVLNGILLVSLLLRLGIQRRSSIIAGVVFLLHPAAYTPLNWIALGFEEIPTVTGTLVAVHLFIRFLYRPRVWHMAAAVMLMLAGCGFKNTAVLLPVWVFAIAAAFMVARPPRSDTPEREAPARASVVRRAILFALPLIAVTVWYAMYVTVPQYDHPAYRIVLSPSSLARGVAAILENLLNPLCVGRPAIGYQEAVPEVFANRGWHITRSLAVIAFVAAWWWLAWRRAGTRIIGLSLWVVIAAWIGPYAAMPNHLLDYAYWALPACAALWGIALGETLRFIEERMAFWQPQWTIGRGLPVAVLILLSYAWIAGAVLHRSNLFVRQARNAQRVDAAAARAADGARVLFVPPSDLARRDTVNGLSLRGMHPDKGLRVEFVDTNPNTTAPDAGHDVMLLALDDLSGRQSAVYVIDRAQWSESHSLPLAHGHVLRQPFSTGSRPVREIHLRLTAFSNACAVQADVFEAGPAGQASRVDGGVVTCGSGPTSRYRPLVLARPLPPHRHYELRLTQTGREAPPDAIRTGTTASDTWPHARLAMGGMEAGPDAVKETGQAVTMRLVSDWW